ncbi:permease [Methylobacterium sp. HMF5984]|uniref:permease n=1 Tax=Methylobacterium sp. HMF5984 TaxID=3367370 RepID=UPI0038548B96
MPDIIDKFGQALLMAAGMAWQTGWTLVLGFTISALLQSIVSTEQMKRALGRSGPKELVLASLAGAASSSCSYASAAIMRTLFKKGAALATSLAFMFASTNLVLELGIILYLLLGWQFMAGEWIGGIVLVAVMSVLVKLTYPKRLAKEARQHEEASGGHNHMSMTVEGDTLGQRLTNPETRVRVAQNFAMEWTMLWKDLAIGFLVGGFLSAFVPDAFWKALFFTDASPWVKIPLNALLGPVIAVLTFVCSIGNVPLAAVLWGGGASFGGVLAFLYADLIVLPLLDTYRRYFGWRMAAYIGGVFYATMVIASLVIDLSFTGLGLVPSHDTDVRAHLTHFSMNYTFWLNLVFGTLGAYLWWVSRKHPMQHGHGGHDHAQQHGGEQHAHHHR